MSSKTNHSHVSKPSQDQLEKFHSFKAVDLSDFQIEAISGGAIALPSFLNQERRSRSWTT